MKSDDYRLPPSEPGPDDAAWLWSQMTKRERAFVRIIAAPSLVLVYLRALRGRMRA
jgi:hypothetical protein